MRPARADLQREGTIDQGQAGHLKELVITGDAELRENVRDHGTQGGRGGHASVWAQTPIGSYVRGHGKPRPWPRPCPWTGGLHPAHVASSQHTRRSIVGSSQPLG